MKYFKLLVFIIILIACFSQKSIKEDSSDNEETPLLKTKEDSMIYFRNQGIKYSIEEKLSPIYKQKFDSINKLKTN